MSIINQVPDGKDPFSVCLISTDCTTTSGIAHRVLAVSYTHLNVESLEKVQPKDLTAGEIGVRLGTTWIPEDVVEDFTFELLGTPWHCQRRIPVSYTHLSTLLYFLRMISMRRCCWRVRPKPMKRQLWSFFKMQ